ncbi:hypothetical protein H4R19_005368, partial [Coemansia spiralis]
MGAVISALRSAAKVGGMARVAAFSVLEYYWRGPRLPAWDLALQVQIDVMHHVIKGCKPQLGKDQAADDAAVQEFVVWMRTMTPKAPSLAATAGISRDITIHVGQVPVDPTAFSGIGIAEDGLRALCARDQQDADRVLVGELLVALPTATALRAHAADAEALLECRPLHDREHIVLYLHGGGYVVGSRQMCRPLTRWISEEAGVRVLATEYRLAPEHPFPAAVFDALIAYKFLLQQGFDASRIIISGDSAGGHLTLVLMHLLRFTHLAQPAALVLISPVSDMSQDKPSTVQNKNYDYLVKYPLESPLSFTRLFYKPGHPLTEQVRAELADMMLSPINGDFA